VRAFLRLARVQESKIPNSSVVNRMQPTPLGSRAREKPKHKQNIVESTKLKRPETQSSIIGQSLQALCSTQRFCFSTDSAIFAGLSRHV